MHRTTKVFLGVAAAALIVGFGFRREYVMRSGDLLDLRAVSRHNGVVVTGSLLASGARITRVTNARYGDAVLVRIYAAGIEGKDDPRETRGSFAAFIDRDPRLTEISVGDHSRWLTIGSVYGVPIRIPRLRRDSSVSRVVWRR